MGYCIHEESITAAENDLGYLISTTKKEIDLSKIDFDELRSKFKETKCRNLAIDDIRDYIEKN